MGKVIKDKYGKIAYIYFKEDMNNYHSYLVDTNLLVDLERAFYCPQNMSDEQKEVLVQYFKDNNGVNKDPIYGLAIQESCWNYNYGKIDEIKEDKVNRAFEIMNTWNKTDARKHYYKTVRQKTFDFLPSNNNDIKHLSNQIFKLNPLFIHSYALILKILIIETKYKLKQRKDSVLELLDFIDNELQCNGAYETYLFVQYQLGKTNAYELASSVFKFQKDIKNPLMKAVNIAWDFCFIRLSIGLIINPSLLGAKNPILVSCDKGLIALAELISLRIVIQNNDNGDLPLLEIKQSDLRPDFVSFADEVNARLYHQTQKRVVNMMNDYNDMDFKRIEKITNDLENELLSLYNS